MFVIRLDGKYYTADLQRPFSWAPIHAHTYDSKGVAEMVAFEINPACTVEPAPSCFDVKR